MISPAKPFKLNQTGPSHYLPASRSRIGIWLVGLALSLVLLTNFALVGGMLAEAIPILLEVAEEALDTLFETSGISPRMAQGITAYIGLTVALGLGYYLLCQVRRLTHQTRQTMARLKTESRHWISATATDAHMIWANLPWHRKLLMGVAGALLFMLLAMMLSTAL